MARIDCAIAGTEGAAAARDAAASRPARAIDWRQLSHELRTPLNAILGNIELLLDGSAGPLSAQARGRIAEAQVAGRALLDQVRLLLAWSELSASGPKPGGDPVDLIALVREAVAAACSRPAQIAPRDACLPISGDPFWLRMLVTEVVACFGAPDAAPKVLLEHAAGHRSVRFFRPGFCAEQAGALRMALIESVARLQGAEVASAPDGLTLHWPTQQLKRPETARRQENPT